MTHEQNDTSGIEAPPRNAGGIIRRLGPGLIIAGSIVGSGELIATTAVGAEAGFWLLWIIVIGCVVKVFTQVEIGRYCITSGKTALMSIAEIPGRIGGRGNWITWFWFLMFLAGLGQLGGIVGGVGQAMSISLPITENGRRYNEIVDMRTQLQVKTKTLARGPDAPFLTPEKIATLRVEVAELETRLAAVGPEPENPLDARLWAGLIAVITSVLLFLGRYKLIQAFATFMVCSFTLITLGNLVSLQTTDWAVSGRDLLQGLSFRLPPSDPAAGTTPLFTALAAFGIIGVGASELIYYPYWCLEKGYARFTGRRDASEAWGERARGWLRVMRWDAWCSMFVYTFATIAFYLLGAAILSRVGLNPGGTELVRTLSVMYEPVFGAYAQVLFLFGAIAVLYSTFFVATASNARVFVDALFLHFNFMKESQRGMAVKIFSAIFPFVCLTVYCFFESPKILVLVSGLMQAAMLPMLATAALFFRYRRSDPRIPSGRVWGTLLWTSALAMLVVGVVGAYQAVKKFS